MKTPLKPTPKPATPAAFRWEELELRLSMEDPTQAAAKLGGFTARMYAERYGLTIDAAWGRLKRMLSGGTIERIGQVRYHGRTLAIYGLTRRGGDGQA